ncbi:MAG: CBS domain-containing protein [Desulfobacterales bacterium]|jgi:CBS domain-containing protein
MLVKEVMTPNVDYIAHDKTLQEVADMMKTQDIGEMPVVIGGEAVGVITDRDIAIRGVAHGLDPKAATVADAMTEGIIVCREDDDIQNAAQTMAARKVRRLPVMNADGKLSGMVSLGDLALNLDPAQAGEVLRGICQ